MTSNKKPNTMKERSYYIRKIWHKLQDLEKRLNNFEAKNSKEHEELRNMINGRVNMKNEQRK